MENNSFRKTHYIKQKLPLVCLGEYMTIKHLPSLIVLTNAVMGNIPIKIDAIPFFYDKFFFSMKKFHRPFKYKIVFLHLYARRGHFLLDVEGVSKNKVPYACCEIDGPVFD
jgi:hypothetical protein